MKTYPFFIFFVMLSNLALNHGDHRPVFLPNSTNFEEIIECSGFVDKTLFIEAFFHFESNPYHLITRPRKFGKTTNMNMLKHFVQLEVGENGRIKNPKKTSAHRIFTNRTLNLRISTYNRVIEKHLGKYPVIHIELKGVMRNTFDETLKNIRERVRNTCSSYKWMIPILLEKNQHKNDPNIAQQIRFLKKAIHGTMNLDILIKSLSLLAKILLNYFRKKLFVFIDDYDVALDYSIRYAHEVKYDPTKITHMLSSMIEKLFNDHLADIKYIMITGLTYSFPSIFFNYQISLEHHKFLSSFEMASFFGFTDDQVTDLLVRHEIDENEKYQLREFYDGYRNPEWGITLYNTNSVLNYLASFEAEKITYPLSWIDPGSLDFMLKALENPNIYTSCLQILMAEPNHFLSQTYAKETHLIKLGSRLKNNSTLGRDKATAFIWYCLENGYITNSKAKTGPPIPLLSFSNKEMEIEFTKILFRFYHSHVGRMTGPLSRAMKNLINFKRIDEEVFNLKCRLEKLINSQFQFEGCDEELHYYVLIYYVVKLHFNDVFTYVKKDEKDDQNDNTYYIVANTNRTKSAIIALKYRYGVGKALKCASKFENKKFVSEDKIFSYIGIRIDLQEKCARVAYFSSIDHKKIAC
ncbi:uncharacterized protein LOC135835450 [Planococcus citri]|uniref:uncharacterized protein LOC135835450 n=1 Tax=Planococcus citri TaxID=170843 RepID=UPI0031F731F8